MIVADGTAIPIAHEFLALPRIGEKIVIMTDFGICYINQGGLMAPSLVGETMTLFAKEVMPHCR